MLVWVSGNKKHPQFIDEPIDVVNKEFVYDLTAGIAGASGWSGYSGVGISGFSGYSGISGATGSGTSGFSGISGFSGYSGKSGFSGYSGSIGNTGPQGVSGYSGAGTSGFSGISGYSGSTGGIGNTGNTGISGFSGYSGKSGYSGYSGFYGSSGFSGISGFSGMGFVGTAGSIPFSTGSALTEDNNSLFWDNTNKRMALGYTAGTAFTKVSPTMTNNTTPSPYVVTESSYFVYPGFGLFNGNTNPWLSALSTPMPQWVSIDMGSPTTVNAYQMGSSDGNNCPATAWKVQGSTDNSNWVDLDTQTGISWSGAHVTVQYPLLGGSVSYRYYRLYVTASTNANLVEVYEFALGTVAVVPPSASSKLHLRASSTGDILQITQAMSGQTGNLSEWRDSNGSILASVSATGVFSGAFSGYSGKSGYSGYSGLSGYSGSGTSGFSGYSGISGFSGYSGVIGNAGTSGFSGISGFSGYSGTGTSGFSGYSGISGFSGYSGIAGVNTTVTSAVTANTNSTGAQTLMSVTPATGSLNTVNKGLVITGSGRTTTATTSTCAISINFGSVVVFTCTTASITATVTNWQWNYHVTVGTVSTGASGTVFCHGWLTVKLTAGTGTATVIIDGNTAASSAIDLTASQAIATTVTFNANAAGGNVNTCTQDLMHVMQL